MSRRERRTLGPAPILIVDDDAKIVQLVRTYLEREGFSVIAERDGRSALEAIRTKHPSLVVLDLMLPVLDGLSVARLVREESDIPILMLSARGSTADRVFGMNEGADDYLAKPFSPAELVARVKAILRRVEQRTEPSQRELHIDDVVVDLDRHEVRRGEERIELTAAEFRLFAALVEADGRVLSRDALLSALYGAGEAEVIDRTVDVYVGRLREKLGDEREHPRYVTTVRGLGYRAARRSGP